MALLQILRVVKGGREGGEQYEKALRELQESLGRFRGVIRGMVKGQLADEDAILNAAAFSILSARRKFVGTTKEEAIAYCRRAVETKTLDHIRNQRGRLIYVGEKTTDIAGENEEDPDEMPGPEGSDPASGRRGQVRFLLFVRDFSILRTLRTSSFSLPIRAFISK